MNLIIIRVKQSEERGLNVPCLPELDKVVIMGSRVSNINEEENPLMAGVKSINFILYSLASADMENVQMCLAYLTYPFVLLLDTTKYFSANV